MGCCDFKPETVTWTFTGVTYVDPTLDDKIEEAKGKLKSLEAERAKREAEAKKTVGERLVERFRTDLFMLTYDQWGEEIDKAIAAEREACADIAFGHYHGGTAAQEIRKRK